ncbi:unnamed protein product [Gongylonema pulchrum]|uniref:Ras family protein n=1 Tax=Gongylonema pulchrum TaxID=637853 RepID=A0A183DX55_9BILA|nr:unnamed protein product [Gongylonema pulchrum]
MSVPVHSTTTSAAVTSNVLLSGAAQPSVIMSTPKINTVVTTLTPPAPLPNLQFPTLDISQNSEAKKSKGGDVIQHRVPYPAASSTIQTATATAPAAVTSSKESTTAQTATAKKDTRVTYAYQPGKTYRTKRVFKVIILGDAGVGKTCLSFRFCNGRFPAQTEATIGVDFRERSVVIDGELIRMFADQNDMALFETSALADTESDHVESIFMTLVHKLQQSKPMHVQSDEERAQKEQRLLLKAAEASKEADENGWCC